jgi:hypothetical protein
MLTRFDAGKAWRSTAAFLLGCAVLGATTAIAFALHTRLMVVALVTSRRAGVGDRRIRGLRGSRIVRSRMPYLLLPSADLPFRYQNPTDVVALIVFVATALLVTNLVNRGSLSGSGGAAGSPFQRRKHSAYRLVEAGLPHGPVSLSDEICGFSPCRSICRIGASAGSR